MSTERNNSSCHAPTKTNLAFLLCFRIMEETVNRSKQIKRSSDQIEREQESLEQRKQQVNQEFFGLLIYRNYNGEKQILLMGRLWKP